MIGLSKITNNTTKKINVGELIGNDNNINIAFFPSARKGNNFPPLTQHTHTFTSLSPQLYFTLAEVAYSSVGNPLMGLTSRTGMTHGEGLSNLGEVALG